MRFLIALALGGSLLGIQSLPTLAEDTAQCGTVQKCAQLALEAALRAEDAARNAIPQGAVMPFNLKECPAGWTIFEPAEGRVIVGAGRGEDLSSRPFQSKGGAETHTLSEAELAPHKHATTLTVRWGDKAGQKVGFSISDGFIPDPKNDNQPTTATEETSSSGSGAPFEIMPPYYALTYCEKS